MRLRQTIILLSALLAACAGYPRSVSKTDCMLDEASVFASMLGVTWYDIIVADSEPVMHGTHVTLNYVLNLDPDPAANQRLYGGLADHARFSVSFGDQFSTRPLGDYVEIRGEGLVIRRLLNRGHHASVEGSDLDRILAGEGDIEIALVDAQGEVLRRDLISRSDLDQADAQLRSSTSQLREHLNDPPRFCALEEIVVT